MDPCSNFVELRGALAGRPRFSHSGKNENYYTFPMDICRLSGAVDTINVIARQELLSSCPADGAEGVGVRGELRSFNNRSGEGSRLVITVFAKEIFPTDGENVNTVSFCGTLCKPPNLRRTPMGRLICDMMLAVNRRYGRSDYLPCIAWGQLAEETSALGVGDTICVDGRIQSRRYIKIEDGVPEERTAFEVSAVSIRR